MTNCPERPTAIGFDLIDAPHPDNDAQRYEITPTHARVEERGPNGVFRQIGGYAHYIDAAAFPTPQDFFAAVRDWIDGLRAGDRFAAREVGDLDVMIGALCGIATVGAGKASAYREARITLPKQSDQACAIHIIGACAEISEAARADWQSFKVGLEEAIGDVTLFYRPYGYEIQVEFFDPPAKIAGCHPGLFVEFRGRTTAHAAAAARRQLQAWRSKYRQDIDGSAAFDLYRLFEERYLVDMDRLQRPARSLGRADAHRSFAPAPGSIDSDAPQGISIAHRRPPGAKSSADTPTSW